MQRTASCPSCSRGVFAEDAFCSWCGAYIQAKGARTGESRRTLATRTIPTGQRRHCSSCNSAILPGDQFCSTCGAGYAVEAASSDFGRSWVSIGHRVTEASHGKYRIEGELGRGGMGIVLVARDTALARPVAIKVLAPSLLGDGAMVERFQREARTIASLRHESIVNVYEVGRAGDLYYFVMDYIDGVSLSRVLEVHGSLPIPAIEMILLHVGSALAYAHRPGRTIVHRDIKPSNIMIGSEGVAVLMDFGISKVSETPSGLTRTGLVMGTPEFMSPEQCRGSMVTPESDQYALGAVLFAMLTGAPPYTGPFYRVLMAHQTDPVPSVLEARPDCPPELAGAVERMLAKSPADRWPSVQEALRALRLRPPLSGDPVYEDLVQLVRATASSVRGAADSGRTSDPRIPTAVRIAPLPDGLEVGDQVGLKATLLFSDGDEDIHAAIRWESTDPAIARVDSDSGQLVAVGAGVAEITADVGGIAQSVSVEIGEPRVVELVLDTTELELETGETRKVVAEPRNRRGEALECPVLWSSSNPRTVSVGESGEVRGHREGAANVLAHCLGVGGSLAVRVVHAAVASVEISGGEGRIAVGDVVTLHATVSGTRGQPLRRAVTWSSSAPGVADVDGAGRLQAVGEGPVEIVATCEGQSAALPLRVLPAPVTSLVIEEAPPHLVVGDRAQLRALARDAKGQALDRAVVWSSEHPELVRVEPDGSIVALAQGVAQVVAGCEDRVARVSIDLRRPPVTHIEVSRPGDELVVGDTFHLEARLLDHRGEPSPGSPTWMVDDPSVLRPLAPGLFRAEAPGEVVIMASADEAVTRVSVTVHAEVGAAAAAVGDAAVGDGAVAQHEASVLSTGDPSPGPVRPGSRIEVRPGSASPRLRRFLTWGTPVLVILGGIVVRAALAPDVPPPRPTDPVIAELRVVDAVDESPLDGPLRLLEGESFALASLALDAAGAPVAHEVRWTTSDTSVVSVDATGRVTGRAPGEATISGLVDTIASRVALVIAARPAALAIVTSPDSRPLPGILSLEQGQSVTLRGVVRDAREAPLDGVVTWTSSDASVASVGPDGALLARASGNARITAASGDLSSGIDLRVAAAPRPVLPTLPVEAPLPSRGPADDAPGTVRLRIENTWAFVRVDGELQDPNGSRVLTLSLAPGEHRLVLSRPGWSTLDTVLVVRPGEEAVIVKRLLGGGGP